MAFKLEDVPKDVQWVWSIQMAWEISKIGVGIETWRRCQDVINAYPEWFPDDPKQELPVATKQ